MIKLIRLIGRRQIEDWNKRLPPAVAVIRKLKRAVLKCGLAAGIEAIDVPETRE